MALVILGLTLGLAGVTADAAYASPPPVEFMPDGLTPTPDAWNVLQDPIRYPPPSQTFPNGSTPEQVSKRLDWGRRTGRVIPSLNRLGQFSMLGSGFLVGWDIGSEIYKLVEGGGTAFSSTNAVDKVRWVWCEGSNYRPSPGAALIYDGTVCSSSDPALANKWHYEAHMAADPANTWTYQSLFVCSQDAVTGPCTENDGQAGAQHAAYLQLLSKWPEALDTPYGTVYSVYNGGTYQKHALTVTNAQFEAHTTTKPATAAEYNNVTNRYATTYTSPAYTTGDKQSAGGVIWNEGDSVGEDATTWIIRENNPSYGQTTFSLPVPQPNETYTAYTGRLQALGHVGTITNTELATVLEGYGPGSPARVLIPGASAGTTTTLDPLAWPTPNPNVLTDAAITLRRNPSTAPEVPTAGGQIGPEGEVPAIDWSPLNVGLGSKFPFGAFDWISTLFGSFTQANELPCWTISRPPGLPDGDGYTVCVPANDYRGYSDPIMKLIVIVASIWFAGTWIVGWSRGETMDGGG